jgi:MerR family transcriptional regulator, light-induced transcriptional regulator
LGLAHGWGSGIGRSVLLACPPGEEHELGLMAFGIVAARRGWRVVYLGPDTPFDTIEATARDVRPAMVVLSASVPEHLKKQTDALRSLAQVVPVAVGGVVDAAHLRTFDIRVLDQDPVSAAHAISDEARRADANPRFDGVNPPES